MRLKTYVNLTSNKQRILSKSKLSIALILLLAAAVFSVALMQMVTAQPERPTYCFAFAAPNPAGIEQSVLLSVFLDRYPPTGPGFVPLALWEFDVTITDPDGTVTTKTVTSDTIGGAYWDFIPDKLGTWTIKAHFPGAGPIAGDFSQTIYLPSDSNTVSLEVQQEPATSWPAAPLPTEYWQRPIESENREWATIAGSWPGMPSQSLFVGSSTYEGVNIVNPYSTGPNSGHIMWTRPLKIGGTAGGANNEGFYTGDSYEREDIPAIIMAGVFYRNLPLNNNPNAAGFEAVDLRTGKTLWTQPEGSISFGQLLTYDSPAGNQHGVIPYLWGSGFGSLRVYDPNTGQFLFDFANVTSGLMIQKPDGTLLQYTLDYTNRRFLIWNSTRAILYGAPPGGPGGFGAGDPNYWRPVTGATYDWNAGVQLNVTVPDITAYGVPPTSGGMFGYNIVITNVYDDVAIARYGGPANETYPVGYVTTAGYSMTDGHQMWVKMRSNPNEIETGALAINGYAVGPGVFMNFKQETMQWHGYSSQTGELIWTTEPYTNPWGSYFTTLTQSPGYCAYGNLYAIGLDGMLHCFDLEDGHNRWNALGYNSGTETPYGSWPTAYMAIADGKVYVSNGEHSPNQPNYRGYELYCVDAETGELLWKTLQYAETPIISDGYLVDLNGYDMQHYCFGKGPSATTVSVGPKFSTFGNKVVIEGTVTDVSPGTAEYTQTARFPNGVPAVSDESESQWMEYVYMQKPLPTNTTGVEVWIDVIDSNGNYRNVGTTTSDMSGFFTFTWEPDIPGDFTVVATFAGSNSYYASYAETSFTVVEPVVTPAPTPTPAPMTDTYVLGIGAAAIVAIIVIGLIIILMIRKR